MSEFGPVNGAEKPATADRATFYGTAYHKVSGRNQVAIPKNFKRAIDESRQDELLLMRWQNEPFLRLYTKKEFDRKLDEVKQKTELPAETRAMAIAQIAKAAEPVEPDSQGRFVLPGKWTDALNIREEVAFAGAFSYIEVWPAELHREHEKAAPEKLAAVSGQLTNILNM